MVMIRKRKVTMKLIEDVVSRKACFKKRLKGFLKKMDQLSTLCDIEACAIIFGPGDTRPRMWPSLDVTEKLLRRFQTIPEVERCKNTLDQRIYMLEKTKKIEDQLVNLKQRNDEKEISVLMHQIHHDGKSLSDLEPSELKRLLCYVEEKQKNVRRKISHFEEMLPHNPPLKNGIDSDTSTYGLVSNQQSLLNSVGQVDKMNNGFDNNTSSNVGLPPHANPSGVDLVFPQGNFGGSDSTGDLEVFPAGNFGGLTGGDNSSSGVFPLDSFGGLNGESDHSGLLPQGDFIGLNVENDSMFLPSGNFGGLNGESNLGLLYESPTCELGGSDVWSSYGHFGSTIGESDMTLPYNNYEGNINGINMGIEQYCSNQREIVDNIGLWCHQNNSGANSNETDMRSFDIDFMDTN